MFSAAQPSGKTRINRSTQGQAKLLPAVASLCNLDVGWDGDGAPPPNANALHWANYIIQSAEAMGMQPFRVQASADGGVTILFAKGNATVAIGSFNGGSVAMAKSSGPGTTTAEDYDPNEDVVSDMLDDARGFLS